MSDIAFNVIGVVTGLLGVIGLIPLISKFCKSLLPPAKLKYLDAILLETERILKIAEDEGLFTAANIPHEHFRPKLTTCREKADALRHRAYLPTTTLRELKGLFTEVSRPIGVLTREAISLRQGIVTSTADAQRILREQGVQSPPDEPSHPDPTPPLTEVVILPASSNEVAPQQLPNPTVDATEGSPLPPLQRAATILSNWDHDSDTDPEFTDVHSVFLLVRRAEKYLTAHGYGLRAAPSPAARHKRHPAKRHSARRVSLAIRSELRRLTGTSGLLSNASSREEALEEGLLSEDSGEDVEWTAEPLQISDPR